MKWRVHLMVFIIFAGCKSELEPIIKTTSKNDTLYFNLVKVDCTSVGNSDPIEIKDKFQFKWFENQFNLYKNDSLVYKDSLLPQKGYQYPSFTFQKKPGDILNFSKDSNEAILFKDYYDGVVEYYKRQ